MILSLILGLVLGLIVPQAERYLKDFAESVWLDGLPISDHEFDLAALLVLLVIASLFLAIFAGGGSAFWLCTGALIGLFGERIIAKVTMKDGK
jgi:hypothetical protein